MKIFHVKFFLFLLFLILTMLGLKSIRCLAQEKLPAGSQKINPLAEIQTVFKPSETIKFGVYSSGIRVGSGKISYSGVVDLAAQKSQNIILQVSTFSLLDREAVYASMDFSKPLRVERYVRFLGKTEVIEEDYIDNAKALQIKKTVNKGEPSIATMRSEESFSNVLALLYWLRNDKDMKKGKSYRVTLPTHKLEFIVKDDQYRIKVPLGRFESFYIESVPPKFKIWLSKDDKRIPVRIQGLVSVGNVYLAAIEAST